jgi:hypothetical protein
MRDPLAAHADNKNAMALPSASVTYGIDIFNISSQLKSVWLEKAAHYTQRFAVLQENGYKAKPDSPWR